MKEQEKEYARSLEMDREKQAERAKKEKLTQDMERQKELAQQRAEKRRQLLSERRSKIVLPEEPVAGEEKIQLRIRFPGSSNQTRSFKSTDLLEVYTA